MAATQPTNAATRVPVTHLEFGGAADARDEDEGEDGDAERDAPVLVEADESADHEQQSVDDEPGHECDRLDQQDSRQELVGKPPRRSAGSTCSSQS